MAIGLAALVVLVVSATHASAHPQPKPDHGLNGSTFYPLWAGDEEATNETVLEERVGENATEMQRLGAISDIPLDRPPEAVEQWNRGEHREFPSTDHTRSIHPRDASLQEGEFLTDAYAAIVAVQPSTRARLTRGSHPLYIAPNGTLRGVVDYRVTVPEASTSPDRRVTYALAGHRVTDTRLLVDGEREALAGGTQTPTLAYEGLASRGDRSRQLTIEATITATIRETVRTCTERAPGNETTTPNGLTGGPTLGTPVSNTSSSASTATATATPTATNGSTHDSPGECLDWDRSVSFETDTLTVRDSVAVTVYTLSVSGYRTSYPDGDFGVMAYKNSPWLGYAGPDGTVRGVWRFYAARDPDWDDLLTRTASGTTVSHSPVHPLQVHAYPIETGPSPDPRETTTITAVQGEQLSPPTLPAGVDLDVVEEPYTGSYSVGARIDTSEHALDSLTATGLVRGVETTFSQAYFATIPFNRSTLSVTILNRSAATTTVELSLRDEATKEPIETRTRDGYLLLGSQRLNTTADGTVTATVAATASGLSARYVPGPWWRHLTAYTGSSAVVYEGGALLGLLSVVYQASIPIGTLLVGVFLIARITGWDIWPPWGRR